ncbi:MAG: cellulose biosynthesis protein BcsS [Pseudomonadota bacterium]
MANGPSREGLGVLHFWMIAFLVMCSSAQAGEVWVSSGVGGSSETLHTYSGATYAPFGKLDESGWRVRAWAKAFRFIYQRAVAPGRNAKITANGLGLEAETGWNFAGQNWDVLGLIGIVWRDHELSRPDPASSLTRGRVGARAALAPYIIHPY